VSLALPILYSQIEIPKPKYKKNKAASFSQGERCSPLCPPLWATKIKSR